MNVKDRCRQLKKYVYIFFLSFSVSSLKIKSITEKWNLSFIRLCNTKCIFMFYVILKDTKYTQKDINLNHSQS